MTIFIIISPLPSGFSNPFISVFYFIVLSSFSLSFLISCAHGYDDSELGSKLGEFNFVVAGDFGCGTEAKKTIEAMTNLKPELAIALGDRL